MNAEERERLEALAAQWEGDAEQVRRRTPVGRDEVAYRKATLLTLLTCAGDLRRALAAEAAS